MVCSVDGASRQMSGRFLAASWFRLDPSAVATGGGGGGGAGGLCPP